MIPPSRFDPHPLQGLVHNGPDEPEPFAGVVRLTGPDGHATLVFYRETLGLLEFPDGQHETKIVGAKQL